MNKFGLAPLAAVISVALVGCSDNSGSSSSSSNISVSVSINQQDVSAGLVRSQLIGESGLPSTNYELEPNVATVLAGDDGLADMSIPRQDAYLFESTGRQADSGRGVEQTQRRCQWFAGCGDSAFGSSYATNADLQWRTVVYSPGNNDRFVVTPFTELAAELALQKIYLETFQPSDGQAAQSGVWDDSGYYSRYSILQSLSQVGQLFGLENIQSCLPADLTRLNSHTAPSSCSAQQSLRYGALLAAWQQANLDYLAAADAAEINLARQVGKELVASDGQLLQAGTLANHSVNLQSLLAAAANNLEQLSNAGHVTNAEVKAQISAVITTLRSDADLLAANPDQLTTISPASVETLLGKDGNNDVLLGIKRSKAFITLLKDYQNNFFEEGYKARLENYVERLNVTGKVQQPHFNQIIDAFVKTKQLYLECLMANGSCPDHQGEAGWQWLTDVSFSNQLMTLNGGAIQVSQRVADINPADGNDDPASSQAIDLLIKGTYIAGDAADKLKFELNHRYRTEDDSSDDNISSAAGVRIYYPQPVSQIQTGADELAYEIRWPDFRLSAYDGVAEADDAASAEPLPSEIEAEGDFRQFYLGVKDPDNNAAERRYNIESVSLTGRISDVIGDDDDADKKISEVMVAARSDNADSFYPQQKFASFNGFLSQRSNPQYPLGHVQDGLLQYRFGEEPVAGRQVQYIDLIIPLGESQRYRFYPERLVEDRSDLDNDRDFDEQILSHDFERCELEQVAGSTKWTVARCGGKERLLGERDIQKSINQLWEIGYLSRIEVDNRGTYFIDWDDVAGSEFSQCRELNTLNPAGASLSGTLYEPAVLGLNSLRFKAEVALNDGDLATKDPDTLLDVSLVMSSADNYQLNAALSHDYSAISNSTLSYGTGADLDRILLSYDTRGSVATSGNLTVYKDGVVLGMKENSDGVEEDDVVDSELIVAMRQVSSAEPLPYTFISNNEGKYQRCVLRDEAVSEDNSSLAGAIIPINFRGAVYGQIRQENGVWVARFINGEFMPLL